MDSIKIGTLNVQNSKINRTGGITPDGIDNAKVLANHIENTGYYFLGTQEITRVFSRKILSNLSKYRLYGNYILGSSKLVRSIPIFNSFNEKNAIITNKFVEKNYTKTLPWFPSNPKDLMDALIHGSIMPRIVTVAKINDSRVGSIYVLNTHIDYQIRNIQDKQLRRIYRIAKSLSYYYPVVITGDFNMEVGIDSHFDEFIQGLERLGLKRVEVNNKTNAEKFSNKTAIDHIFIPGSWMIENAGLINDDRLNTVTDHKGVFADVKVR